jgi:crotonobetainyl-CoA:carnitine CoA-transferase CaiB-like acyl-CoA transferase
MTSANTPTLKGIRVLDLGSSGSTAWCTRLLADYGAEVFAVEPEGGHPLRADPPFDDRGISVAARYFLSGKKLVDAAETDTLIGGVHVIVSDAGSESDRQPAALAAANGKAIICAITPYGLTGSRADLPAAELTVSALSGWASVNGLVDREPLKPSGYQVAFQTGTFAFGCVTAALIESLAGEGDGQIIDIAELEVLVSTFAPAPLRFQYSGFVWPRKQARDVNDGPVPVADGFFALTISRPAFWIKAMRILGLPDLADDEELQQPGLRHKFRDRFVERMSEAMSRWKRMDLFNALAAERVIAGPVLTMDELGENPQLNGRGFFRVSGDGIRYPGPFARMSRSQWLTPQFDTSRHSVDAATAESIQVTPRRAGSTGLGPLAGFRGLVLTQAWAGTYATELLALLGAEVIQLEVRKRLDSWRGTYQNPIPRGLLDQPTARHSWNVSPLYNSVNLNKQCITVDLDTAEGIGVFRQLVASVDFVAENFSPRVMGKLGLDYETLCGIRPDLIMASLSAYGATGPWANVPGIGGTIEPSSGMSALLGYEGEDPLNSGQMYPDPAAGLCGFSAIALALLHRDRTGEGQFIDLSMQEANFTFVGDAWLEFELTGNVRGPQGNRHPRHAPHGIYPAAGDDQWIAIAVETATQWQALVDLLDLGFDPNWGAAQRKALEVEIDDRLATLTAGQGKQQLAERLTRAGIPAAAVLDAGEVASDPGLRERGHMVKVIHSEAGAHWQSGLPAIFSRTPGGVTRAAPLQGQHSREVLSRLAGVQDEEYESLVKLEVTGRGAVASSTVANQA